MRRFLPLAALLAALSTPSLAAQDWFPDKDLEGVAAGEDHGFSVARLDVFGAPLSVPVPHIAVGAFSSDANGLNSGAVFVYDGATGAVTYSASGESAGDLLGFDVVGLGPLVPGARALAASAPFFSNGPAGLFAGRVYILDSQSQALLGVLDAPAPGELFGYSLAAADMDNDGTAELAVGAPGAGPNETGKVYIYRWNGASFVSLGSVAGGSEGEFFGFNLAAAGNLDGVPGQDVLASAPFADGFVLGDETGLIEVIGGSNPPSLGGSPVQYKVNSPGAHLGVGLSGGLNFGGDSTPDVIAGGPDHNGQAGLVVAFRSGGAVYRFVEGTQAGAQLGYSVLALEDITHDGRAEMVAGSPEFDGTGKVEVFDLNPPAPLAGVDQLLMATFDGTAGSQFGWSLAQVGDLDGIAGDDLAIGAPRHDGPLGVRQGLVQTWLSVPRIEVFFDGLLSQGQDTPVLATNLIPGTTVRFYVDSDDDPINGGTLFDTSVAVDNGTGLGDATGVIPQAILDAASAGETLFIQALEDTPVQRVSNVISDELLPAIVLSVSPDPITAGEDFTLQVTGLIPGSTAKFWADTDAQPVGGILLGQKVANASGQAAFTVPGAATTGLEGLTAVFQIEEIRPAPPLGDPFPNRLSNLLVRTLQAAGPDLMDLDLAGPGTVPGGITLNILSGAHPDQPVFFYGGLRVDPGPPTNPVPGLLGPTGVKINVRKKTTELNQGNIVFSNGAGQAQLVVPGLPASTSGLRLYFQAVSVDDAGSPNVDNFILSDVEFADIP